MISGSHFISVDSLVQRAEVRLPPGLPEQSLFVGSLLLSSLLEESAGLPSC